jgi:hypothetical protein
VITDPDDDGNALNTAPALQWSGRMAGSETVEGTRDGLFDRFSVANANRDAVSRVGLVDDSGIPRDRFAFLVANVGNLDRPGRGGGSVDVSVALLDGEGESIGSTPQFNLPYRVVTPGGAVVESGRDLVEDAVRLSTAQIAEVVIEVDSRTGIDDVERIETMYFVSQPPGNP